MLREWLGDRLVTSWLHTSPRVRAVRSWLGRVGVGLGVLALLASLVLGATRPGGTSGAVSLVLALCGLAALGVALLPDVIGDVVVQVRQRRGPLTGGATPTGSIDADERAEQESYAEDRA